MVHKKFIKLKKLRIEAEADLEITGGESLSENIEEIDEVRIDEKKMH